MSKPFREILKRHMTFERVIFGYQMTPQEYRERFCQLFNETMAIPLFNNFHKESKYIPIDMHQTSLTITMLIKDEEADDELMERVCSGELEKELNETISKHTKGIKIESITTSDKEYIESEEEFEEIEKKARDAAYSNPLIVPPSPAKVSYLTK